MNYRNQELDGPPPTKKRLAMMALGSAIALGSAQAEIILQESFETNGAGTRYEIIDGLVSEPADHAANGVEDSQSPGPVYFAHSFEVSFVGVRVPAAARRAVTTWRHDIPAGSISDQVKESYATLIDWLTEGRSSTTALFSPPPAGDGDQMIVDILTAKGFTIVDDAGGTPPEASTVGIVVHSSSASDPSRFTTYAAPLLTYNASDHDDELTSTIGQSNTSLAIETARVEDSSHPAAPDITGDFAFVTGATGYDTIGSGLPADGITVLSGVATVPAPVEDLATVTAMAAGDRASIATVGDLIYFQADFNAGAGGSSTWDNPPPGNPAGGFGIVAKGKLEVFTPGVYSVGIGIDDGARLRIDLDGNGLDDNDWVLEDDASGAFRELAQDADFSSAGQVDFEWTSFNSGGDFGAEIFVAINPGGGSAPPLSNLDAWTALGDHFPSDGLQLSFDGIEATTYVLDEPPVQETRPLIVVVDEGQPLLGGPITGADGKSFFAGSAMNKFGTVDPNSIIFNSVSVSGQSDLKISFLVAGSNIDFENSDYLDAFVDINDSGSADRIVRFTAASGDEKFISAGDVDVSPEFQQVTFDVPIPDGVTPQTATIRFDFHSTWFNEVIALDNVILHSGPLQDDTPPELTWAIKDGRLELSWDKGDLQSSTTATGPFENVAGGDASSPHTSDMTAPAQYFQVAN